MFGLNLWTRPFLPGAPGAMGMEGPGGIPRSHPALGLGAAPTYLLPGLSAADKAASTAAMHSPFAPGSLFMYRPDSMLHPHMLRVNVDHGLQHLSQAGEAAAAAAAAAERALPPHSLRPDPHGAGSDSGSVESYPSAFQPTKRVRLTAGEDGHARTPSRHSDSGHKAGEEPPTSSSSYYGDRMSGDDGRTASSRPSPGSSSVRSPDSARGSPHDARHSGGLSPARSEARTPGGPPRCPVCGVGLAPGEVDAHYIMELERLRVLARMERGENGAEGARDEEPNDGRSSGPGVTSSSGVTTTSATSASSTTTSSPSGPPGGAMSVSESRYETYLKIRNNRHVRLCVKTRARRKRPSDTPPHDGMDPRDEVDHFSSGHHAHPALQHLHAHHHPAPPHHPHHPHHPQSAGLDQEHHHLQSAAVNTISSSHRTSMMEAMTSHLPVSSYQSPVYQTAPHHSPSYPPIPGPQPSPGYPPVAPQRSPNYPSSSASSHQSPPPYHGGHRSPSYPPPGHRSPSYPGAGRRSPPASYQQQVVVGERQTPPSSSHAHPAPASPRPSSPCRQSPPAPASPPAPPASRQPESDDDDDEFIRVDSPRPESVIVNVCTVDGPTPRTESSSGSDGTSSPHLTIPASHLARQPVSIKCQVCQGAYSRPVTSVTCWHVHCEDCWIKTMGNKRVCPQCKSVTAQSDLRKVYI